MKKPILCLLTAIVLIAGSLPAAALTHPTVSYQGKDYYEVTGRADYTKLAQYLIDSRAVELPICISLQKMPDYKTDHSWFSDVRNFDRVSERSYFNYTEYSVDSISSRAMIEDGTDIYGYIEASFYDSDEELKKADALIDAKLAEWRGCDRAEIIRRAADLVCAKAEYGAVKINGGYAPIDGVCDLMTGVHQNTVCSSYAFLFQRIMERAGIPCYIATGLNHAWNEVEADGLWYAVDCTGADAGDHASSADVLRGTEDYGHQLAVKNNVFAQMERDLKCRFAETYYGNTAATTTKQTDKTATENITTGKFDTASYTTNCWKTTERKTTATDATAPTETASTTAATPVGDTVTVFVNDRQEVAADSFRALRENGGTLVLEGGDYRWVFPAGGQTDAAIPGYFPCGIAVGETVPADDRAIAEKLSDGRAYVPFSFAYHGDLPGEATVTLSVGAALAGKNVTVYSVNEAGEAVAEATAAVTDEGTLTFTTRHCSLWFAAEDPDAAPVSDADDADTDPTGGIIWWVIGGIAALAVIAAAIVMLRKKRG